MCTLHIVSQSFTWRWKHHPFRLYYYNYYRHHYPSLFCLSNERTNEKSAAKFSWFHFEKKRQSLRSKGNRDALSVPRLTVKANANVSPTMDVCAFVDELVFFLYSSSSSSQNRTRQLLMKYRQGKFHGWIRRKKRKKRQANKNRQVVALSHLETRRAKGGVQGKLFPAYHWRGCKTG